MSGNQQRPGLLRTAVRTPGVAGTATATSCAVANRMDQKVVQAQVNQAAMMPLATEVMAGAPVVQPVDFSPAQLKDAGVLTEEEFSLAKARLLS